MNYAFYASLDRIPLGVAVTFEFVGPLGVAVFGSRRALDLLWVALAAAGILLLADPGGRPRRRRRGAGAAGGRVLGGLHPRQPPASGRRFPAAPGLALAMVVACVLVLPAGMADGGAELLDPVVLGVGLGVAILSSAVPYSLEFEALRRLPAGVFGVLMSLEPAMAALAGLRGAGRGARTRASWRRSAWWWWRARARPAARRERRPCAIEGQPSRIVSA